MSTIAAELRIQTHAKRLRLPLIGTQAVRYADEAATAGHDHLEFLAICALAGEVEPARWEAACATALARGVISLAGVRAALQGHPAPAGAEERVTLPPALVDVVVAAGDPAQYDRLLEAVG